MIERTHGYAKFFIASTKLQISISSIWSWGSLTLERIIWTLPYHISCFVDHLGVNYVKHKVTDYKNTYILSIVVTTNADPAYFISTMMGFERVFLKFSWVLFSSFDLLFSPKVDNPIVLVESA